MLNYSNVYLLEDGTFRIYQEVSREMLNHIFRTNRRIDGLRVICFITCEKGKEAGTKKELIREQIKEVNKEIESREQKKKEELIND